MYWFGVNETRELDAFLNLHRELVAAEIAIGG